MRNLVHWMGWLALAVSWSQLFAVLALFIALTMSPFDASILQPAAGSWQQQLNDFFASGPGGMIAAGAIVLASFSLALRAFWRNRQSLPRLLLSNVLALLLMPVGWLVSQTINFELLFAANERGFHLSMLPMLVLLVTCGAWLSWQWRIGQHKAKRKRHLSYSTQERVQAAGERLQADTPQATHVISDMPAWMRAERH